MFGKQAPEPKETEKTDLSNMTFSSNHPLGASPQQNTVLQEEESVLASQSEQPELVNLVEKISSIISPYFIVIVGLALYKNNFLIGTTLIVVGILSLLKVSSQDVGKFFQWVKNFFGIN